MSDITLGGTVAPGGTFPIARDTDLKGGYRVVADVTARDAILDANKTIGMLVFVQANTTVYQLTSTGPDVWSVFNPTASVVAGAGLTGGGALSGGSVTVDAVANIDGSIVVNANDIQVGVLATDAQHGVRGRSTGGSALHTRSTFTEDGFESYLDKQFAAWSVAQWNPSFVRVYLVDNDAGVDGPVTATGSDGYTPMVAGGSGNVPLGFSDFDPSDASDLSTLGFAITAIQPVKTSEYLRTLMPRNGFGRMAIVLFKTRSGGVIYKKMDGTTDDYLDINYRGYKHLLFRGSSGLVDTIADRLGCGFITKLAGPNGDSSWTVQSYSSLAAGTPLTVASGTLTAEPALLGYRFRMTGNTTASYASDGIGACHPIYKTTSTTIQAGDLRGIFTPNPVATTERFMIESPGVQFSTIVCNDADCQDLYVAGFKLATTSAITWKAGGRLHVSGLDIPSSDFTGPGTAFGGAGSGPSYVHEMEFSHTYISPRAPMGSPAASKTTVIGMGTRIGGLSTGTPGFSAYRFIAYDYVYAINTPAANLVRKLSCNGMDGGFGGSYYKGTGPSAFQINVSGGSFNATNPVLTTSKCPPRFDGMGIRFSDGSQACNGYVNFRGGEWSNTTTFCFYMSSGQVAYMLGVYADCLIGTTGNTSWGVVVGGRVAFYRSAASTNLNTVAGTLGEVVIGSGNGIPTTHSDLVNYAPIISDFGGLIGNDLQISSGNAVYGVRPMNVMNMRNNSAAATQPGHVVKMAGTTAQRIQLANATTSANADKVIGVCMNATTAAGDKLVQIATTGGCPFVRFTAANPTIGAMAYLSDTDGLASTTPGTKTVELGVIMEVHATDTTMAQVALNIQRIAT